MSGANITATKKQKHIGTGVPGAGLAPDTPAGFRPKLLITIADAAELLSVHKGTFYRLYNSGVIGPQFVKLGRSARINAAELKSWVASGCPCRSVWLAIKEIT